MTTRKNLVKQVLMSTLTAGLFAVSFTACSDELDNSANDVAESSRVAGANDELLNPLGLVYTDFINSNDVQILNDDTTMISVSKAYADKMGINNFVNHPMGIWQSLNEAAYLRRATSQRLSGDRYILNVVPSALGEIIQDGELKVNTALYVDPSKQVSTRAAGGDARGAQYVDDNGVIHPAAITLNLGEGAATRGAGNGNVTFTPEDLLGHQTRNAVEDFFTELIRGVGQSIVHGDPGCGVTFSTGGACDLFTFSPTINRDFKIECGKESGDTITLGVKCPTEFTLGYRMNMYVVNNKVKNFETALTGSFAFKPQLTVGSSKKLEIPEDKSSFKLTDLPGAAFTIYVMGVPVLITLVNHMDVKFDASVQGKIYAGIKYEFASTFEAGLKYDGSWHPITDGEITKNEVSFITPRADVHAETGIGLLFCSDVLVGGVVGPTASVGPKLGGELDMTFAPFDAIPFKADAAIKMGVYGEVGAKLALWKIQLAKFTCPFTLGPEITLWEYSNWKDKDNDDSPSTFYFNDMTKKAKEEAEAARREKMEDYSKRLQKYAADCNFI